MDSVFMNALMDGWTDEEKTFGKKAARLQMEKKEKDANGCES